MLHDWIGFLAGDITGSSAIRAVGSGLPLGGFVGWAPSAAQGHSSGSCFMWGQRLYSTVGQGCFLGFLSEWATEYALMLLGICGHMSQ